MCIIGRSYTLITFGSYMANKAPDFPAGEEKLGSECSLGGNTCGLKRYGSEIQFPKISISLHYSFC